MSYRNREDEPCADEHRWRPEVYDWPAGEQAALDECCIHCGWSQRELDDRHIGFVAGAQACREMLARFVEQGGDPITAASIRANWSPRWGPDPSNECMCHETYPQLIADRKSHGPGCLARKTEGGK